MVSTEFADQLREGLVQMYCLDLHEKALTLRVDVLDGALTHYKVVFSGIVSFRFDCDKATPWDRIELTDIAVRKAIPGWQVEMNLWDSAALNISCGRITVNGLGLV